MEGASDVLISRQDALNVADEVWSLTGDVNVATVWDRLKTLPTVNPSLYGYKYEQLVTIALVLHKEGLPPERVTEALTDIDRLISLVRDEFEEALRKTLEQHIPITDKKGEPQ